MTVLGIDQGAFDGNAEQVRSIAGQMASAFGRGIEEERHLLAEVDSRIKAQVEAMGDRLKLWVLGGILTQIVMVLPIIFFLGGIYSTNNATLELIRKQQATLERRGGWMSERERWEQGVEQWAGPKGFVPPRYREQPR